MRATRLLSILLALPGSAFGQAQSLDEERADGVTVHLGAQDFVSFHLADGVVTRLDVRARDTSYTVPLDCAGGLRDVHYDTAKLSFVGEPRVPMLLFDVGREDERRFGALPRVNVAFDRGRVTTFLIMRMTGERSSSADNPCETLPNPPDPLCAADAPRQRGLDPAAVVEQLRGLPTPLGLREDSPPERTRRALYQQILSLGPDAVPFLAHGLEDADAGMRRSVALAFGALNGGWWSFECGHAKLETRSALPALTRALGDADADVRAWSAQAIGNLGAAAASAVPQLIALLGNGEESSRNSAAIALRGIGPAARVALPALREALADRNADVRRFAANAIQAIEAR